MGRNRNDLTPAEVAVFKLIGEGCSTKEVAALLKIAATTVQCHLYSIRRKTDTTDPMHPFQGKAGSNRDNLTPAEVTVLKLICDGCSTKEIASLLKISGKTVACHRSRIHDKTGSTNSVHLFRWALKEGLVQLEFPLNLSHRT